jgi:branched-subunit amino acid ABC-type transport system permease component
MGLFRSLDCIRGRRKFSGSTGNVVKEVGELVGVKGVVVGRVENVVGRIVGGVIIAVIFVVVDNVVRAPFDDEATVLEEGLSFFFCEGLDPGNGLVSDRK